MKNEAKHTSPDADHATHNTLHLLDQLEMSFNTTYCPAVKSYIINFNFTGEP